MTHRARRDRPASDHRWDTVWYQAALYFAGRHRRLHNRQPDDRPENSAKLDRFFARLNTPVGQEQVLIAAGLEPRSEEILPEEGTGGPIPDAPTSSESFVRREGV